uniref:Integrase catalytic domain-containing protein n=1 Tax=Phytophthora ramorum TaxID=164328 RepID=H3HAI1_PHYRM
MTHLRQQLRNVGSEHAISDDEMARLLLMGVAMTHRELVEQFDLPTRQGNPPTLQQVTNALRSRDERDRMANRSQAGQDGGIVMNMNGGGGSGSQGGRSGRKSLPKCYHCKKPGHLKRDCYQYKNKHAKVKANQSKEVKKKAWSKDKTKQEPGIIEHMEFLNDGDEDSSSSEDDVMVGMVQPATVSKNASEWMLDTGTSTHVCINRDSFVTQKQSKTMFKVWDGQVTRGVMSGQVVIYTKNQNIAGLVKLELSNVEYSPRGSVNLISLGVMEDNGWEMSSSPNGESPRKIFLEQPKAHKRLVFVKRGKHYWLKTVEFDVLDTGMAMMTVNADANELMLWHERLGHLHVAAIKHMVDNKSVAGMKIPVALFKKPFSCLSCMSAKRKRMSYKASAAEKRTKVNYERLTSDTCEMGKFLPGLGNVRYFQLIHDEGSRYKWCFPLKNKSDANANTIKLITELLAAGHKIKSFTSDGGGEFVNSELKLFMQTRGIRFVPTHPYTPEENALVEKLNGVLVNKMRAAMHAADLPNRLWPEVLQYIVDIDNMSPTRALKGKTPSEKLLGTVPNVAKEEA